jgi:two-component system, cell cycle response regulator
VARILILDNDPATLALAASLLRARGHEVVNAAHAHATPDLVLCNVRHPDASARAAHKAGAVLLLFVAPGDAAMCEQLLAQGGDGYIGLPLEAGSLVDEVEAFLPQPALLLVDDDPFMLGVLEDVVRNQGWRVLTAASGEEALALLARETVAVVLSDQRMPGMSGAELLAELRVRHPACVRILLSGQRDDEAIALALERGDAERFLAKPWHGETLLAALHDAFRVQRGRGAG